MLGLWTLKSVEARIAEGATTMPEKDVVQAVVQKVCPDGRHGPYAIATAESLGSITFSLDGGIWDEEGVPEPGEIVMLSKLRKKRAGWKAMFGRRYRPSDEKTQHQQRSK